MFDSHMVPYTPKELNKIAMEWGVLWHGEVSFFLIGLLRNTPGRQRECARSIWTPSWDEFRRL